MCCESHDLPFVVLVGKERGCLMEDKELGSLCAKMSRDLTNSSGPKGILSFSTMYKLL